MLKTIVRLAILASFTFSIGNAQRPTDNGAVNIRDFGARGDGITDDLPAINRAFDAVAHNGQRLLFPAGTYAVSGTILIPNKTQIFGVGRGDSSPVNTVIKALPNFPPGAPIVQMGAAPDAPNFGVQIENLTVDGVGVAETCLLNLYSEEQSYGRNLILAGCTKTGLRVMGSVAQNSGPFENLELLPASGAATNVETLCVEISAVDGFRGIKGLTCNAGDHYAARPALAMKLDGTGIYQDIHIEHFTTGIMLGNASHSADTLILADAGFGPDVTTGVEIPSHLRVNNQNLTILGISCNNCKTLLRDGMTGTNITDGGIGWYLLGNGPGKDKALIVSNYGVGSRFFAPLRAPQVQLTSTGAQPACSALSRGTFWFVQSPPGVADHVQVCTKTAGDRYTWSTVF